MTLVNQADGTINGNAGSRLVVDMGSFTGDGSLTNAGTIEATGAAGLTIQNTKIDNSGGKILALGAGSLVLSKVNVSAGTIRAAAGAQLVLQVANITDASVTTAVGGVLTVASGTSSIEDGGLNNAGTVNINDGAQLTVGGDARPTPGQ